MSIASFHELNHKLKGVLQRQDTTMKEHLYLKQFFHFRYLASGCTFTDLHYTYRLGLATISNIVREVCLAIWNVLRLECLPVPTKQKWEDIASCFEKRANFPNCLGAVDGKHIRMVNPVNAGSTFYNYKGSHSIVLLALVDADYKFITIDVGAYGRNSDGGIFEKSEIGKKLQRGTFSVPGNVPLKTNGLPQPHIIVGDEAFPLKTYLLRPYSRFHLDENEPNNKYINYRLSRARRVVENAFGILVARWRVFRRHLEVQPYLVDKIVLASCCLHNMLCSDSLEPDIPTLRSREAALQNLQGIRRNYANDAFRTRETFKEYFNSPIGAVPWQIGMIRRGRIHHNSD
nr:unnamed protein product [Callosobruchus analis]